MEELQKLIDKWKQEAASLERHNEREYDQCLFFQNNGSVLRLRKCIDDAELLLKAQQPNNEIAPPLQQAGVPRSAVLPVVGKCSLCGHPHPCLCNVPLV